MKLDESAFDQKLSLELTPLIDIIFLLVLFFAVSTSFISGEDLSALKDSVVLLARDREELSAEVEQKTRRIEEQAAQVGALQEQLVAAGEEAERLESMVSALRSQRVELESSLDRTSEESKSLKAQLEQAYRDFESLQLKIEGFERQRDRAAENAQLLRALLLERDTEKAVLEQQVEDAQAAREGLVAERDRSVAATMALRGRLRDEEAARAALARQLATVEADKDRTEQARGRAEDERARLAALLEQRAKEIEAAIGERDELAAQERLLQALLAERAAKLEGLEVRIVESEQQREAVAGDLAALRTRASELESGRESATAEAARLRTEMLKLRNELAKYRKVAELDREQIDRILAAQEQLRAGLADDLAANRVGIRAEQQRLTLQLQDRILFDSGSAEIKPEGLAVLRKVGGIINERAGSLVVQIGGHTDNVPVSSRGGPLATNWGLSAARAVNVVRFLEEDVGIASDRLSAVGYGEHQPVASNDTPEGRARNRRIEIVLVPR